MNRNPDFDSLATQAMVALLGAAAGTAGAQTTIYGGGATLPAPAYVGPKHAIDGDDPANARLTAGDPDAHSLFWAYNFATGNSVSYCQTGSGTGKDVFTGVSGFVATSICPSFSQSVSGFQAPTAVADFAASDSPIAATDLAAFTANEAAAHSGPVQIPSVEGLIVPVFNNPQIPAGGVANITTSQLCGIFSGSITNWDQLTMPAGGPYPSLAINVVYRSDGSGTSFNFSAHLAEVCNSTGNVIFQTNQTFSDVPVNGLPADSTGESGNPGVVEYVNSSAGVGAIGYAEFGDATAISPTESYFTIDGVNPTAGLQPTQSVTYTTGAIIGANDTLGRPTLSNVASTVSQPECLLLVDPNSYASLNPIVAVTYLLGYQTGNTNAAAVGELLGAPYNSNVTQEATYVQPTNGYAWLSLIPSGGTTPTTNLVAIASACIGN